MKCALKWSGVQISGLTRIHAMEWRDVYLGKDITRSEMVFRSRFASIRIMELTMSRYMDNTVTRILDIKWGDVCPVEWMK